MSLSEATIDQLKGLLSKATALVFVDGRPVGAAFFISDNLLLTCEHVVTTREVATTHETVEIQPIGRERRSAEVVSTDGADLALLRSHWDQGEPSPCVVLNPTLDQGDCFVASFPREDGLSPGLEIFDVKAHPRKDLIGGDQILEIEAGKTITWGMSGGPVVSARSGAVIGIVRSSKDPVDSLGGGAVPISRAAEAFGQIAEVLRKSTLAMVPWRNALGRDNWQRLGRSWNIEECIDLRVSGKRHRWLISMDQAAGPGLDRTGPDLGEGVAEALFHWAQRRRIRDVDEVALLGPLLANALFPQGMADHLSLVSQADRILVRLHVERGNDLADIPWELAAVPREKDRFLAADQRFRFARVVDEPSIPTTPAAPKSPANVTVLAAVAQPARWKYPEVHGRYGSNPYAWPEAARICARLRESIERSGFTVDLHESPQPSNVLDALEASARQSRPYDVLHYMGTGQRGPDGKALIAFVDDEGGEAWEDARSILDTAARTGVRLVVLELLLPPEGQDYEPLTHRALYDVVGGSVNAAVLTHLPVHPLQCQKFNGKFYEVLRSGESVETAVQLGRYKLKYDRPVEDAAGFGWFTIVTGPQSDICLVSRRPEDPTMSGARQPSAADRAADQIGEPLARRPSDVLHR